MSEAPLYVYMIIFEFVFVVVLCVFDIIFCPFVYDKICKKEKQKEQQ